MAVTIADIKKLRELTGAGMSDCKKALEATNNDFDKAVEEIRKKGQAVAAKREARDAAQGTVVAAADGKFGAIVALKCETDFVATNDRFVALANKILALVMANKPATLDEVLALPTEEGTVKDSIVAQSGVTGEKMELGTYEFITGESVVAYNHFNHMLSTVVAFNQADADATVTKNVALQVAAMNPVALDEANVPQEVKDAELKVAIEKTKEEQINKAVEAALKKAGFNLYISENEEHLQEGIMKGTITEAQADEIRALKAKTAEEKAANLPEQMIQNIAQGRLKKFFKDSCLMEQEFVQDAKLSVKEYLNQASKGLVATAFKRVNLNVD